MTEVKSIEEARTIIIDWHAEFGKFSDVSDAARQEITDKVDVVLDAIDQSNGTPVQGTYKLTLELFRFIGATCLARPGMLGQEKFPEFKSMVDVMDFFRSAGK